MNPVTRQKIKNNWHIAVRSVSSYVVTAVTVGGGWWLSKTLTEQLQWLNDHPALAPLIPWAPWISGALWVITKLWPQWFPRPPEVHDQRVLDFDNWLKKAQELGFVVPALDHQQREQQTVAVDPLYKTLRMKVPHARDETLVAVVQALRSEGVDLDPTHPAFAKEKL